MNTTRGKTVAITGAGGGIGRSLALELARRGARLALADVNDAGLAETVEQARVIGAEAFGWRTNVAAAADVEFFASASVQQFGVVHQVYNNAGIVGASATISDMSLDEFERVLGVNLWGVVHGTKAFLPHLVASGEGHVINVSSLNGIAAQPNLGAYVSSKFAVRGFTETLREEMIAGGFPVAVTVVHPGGVKTGIAERAADGVDDPVARRRAEVYEKRLFRTTADEAARIIVNGVERGRPRILIAQARAVDRLVRLLPARYPAIMAAWDRHTFGRP